MTDELASGLALDEFHSTIRPQDDLYRYVNGAWLERTEIPDDKARWGSFHQLAEQAEHDVHVIVEEAQNAQAGTDARRVGDLYTSFMDVAGIAVRGLDPLREPFARIDAITSIPEFLAVAGVTDREGIGALLGLYVAPDPGNPERYVPFVTQAGLSLPDESYYRLENFEKTREAFRSHLERLLGLAAVPNAADTTERVIALEHAIAAHHWDNVANRDAVKTYNLLTWQELQDLAGVDLTPWRDGAAPGKADAFAEIVVSQPSFIEGLGALLTDDRLDDWKAWLRAQTVHGLAAYLTDDIVLENFSFYGTELTGVPTLRERWKRGVSLVEGALGDAVGQIYVERHFPPAAKAAMDELVANLIEAYRRSITDLEWMTPETRERALEKLATFRPKIGHPDVWRDYSSIDIQADDLVGNVRRANIFEHDRQINKIGGPIDREEWLMPPQMVNAYYHPLLNEIVFPAAILQYPFFDPNRDAAANYGGIGAVIGHEIGHGFDDQGSRYDGAGKLNDWWTETDRESFEQRTAALIDQYNALVPQGLSEEHHVNGALTIGENIGDLGGLGIALKAYALSLEDADGTQRDAPVIDGYTGVQRLLLSWAQVWQQKARDAETIRLLTIDPHSPNEFRCNQIVRNIDAFHEAFDTTPDDELWMAPEERVTIW
ncbi:M13 family metallopeptidase [Microbacterium sp. YY-01]|uniref:M13 family metallopeptidase n=1 Tax=Microbacterium sp. YY-01 TaxID=3421634 RepID=UPI003D166D8F